MYKIFHELISIILREAVLPSQVFTVISIFYLVKYRPTTYLLIIFMKILGTVFIAVLSCRYRSRYRYFSHNFSLSGLHLLLIYLVLDFGIYLPILLFTIKVM